MSFNLTIVSAYSNPESVVSYVGNNTGWFYVGYRLEYYQKFRLIFEKIESQNIATPALLFQSSNWLKIDYPL